MKYYDLANGERVSYDEDEHWIGLPDLEEVLPVVLSDDLMFLLDIASERMFELSDRKFAVNDLDQDELACLKKLRQIIENYQDYTDTDPWY